MPEKIFLSGLVIAVFSLITYVNIGNSWVYTSKLLRYFVGFGLLLMFIGLMGGIWL